MAFAWLLARSPEAQTGAALRDRSCSSSSEKIRHCHSDQPANKHAGGRISGEGERRSSFVRLFVALQQQLVVRPAQQATIAVVSQPQVQSQQAS